MKYICCNDIDSIKELFKFEGGVLALGKGGYYQEVKKSIEFFNLKFRDVLLTDKDVVGIETDSGADFNSYPNNLKIVICTKQINQAVISLEKNSISRDRLIYIDMSCTHERCINIYKKNIAYLMREKHELIISNLSAKKDGRVKVVFLVISKSIWKLDVLYKKLASSKVFEPLICIVPNIKKNSTEMWEEIRQCVVFFNEKNYEVFCPYDFANSRWIELGEIDTDIVFFTFPHRNTRPEYYDLAYFNFLSCYAGYGANVAAIRDGLQFNQVFHNAQWINFSNSRFVSEAYVKYSASKGINVLYAGDLTCESILFSQKESNYNAWRDNNKKRVIYAPHHSIEENEIYKYRLSTFLEFAESIKKIAEKYKDEVDWAFKPHPWLKDKLYAHPDWGREKTDEYYSFWENSSFTQFENADYVELFRKSNTMIHDSASFLYEYLSLKKPVLYLSSDLTEGSLNKLGIDALECCYIANKVNQIEEYVLSLIRGKVEIKAKHENFYRKEFSPYFMDKPSEIIISCIKSKLKL